MEKISVDILKDSFFYIKTYFILLLILQDNVTLPAWSKQNPRLFIHVMRQALESTHVSCNLNFWIDLIFGFKQSGRSAIDSINCYHPACYFGYPVEQISDTVHRRAIETMIKTWGQTPKQLFTSPHPQSQLKKSNSSQQIASAVLSFGTANNAAIKLEENSIHRLIFNIKWGNYVGSLEQIQPPVCIWKESCKKNICSLIPLATNDVIGLAQHKCLLVDRPKETGLNFHLVFFYNFSSNNFFKLILKRIKSC